MGVSRQEYWSGVPLTGMETTLSLEKTNTAKTGLENDFKGMVWRAYIFEDWKNTCGLSQLRKCLGNFLREGIENTHLPPHRFAGGARSGRFCCPIAGNDAYISREERRASLCGPEPASKQWRNLRPLALPPHGAAPGAAAGRGRALGDAGAAGHRRLRDRLPVSTSGEAGRARERRWVFVRAPVEHSACQYVRDCRWDLGQCVGLWGSVCVCVCERERERTEDGLYLWAWRLSPRFIWGPGAVCERELLGRTFVMTVKMCLQSVMVRTCPSEYRVRVWCGRYTHIRVCVVSTSGWEDGAEEGLPVGMCVFFVCACRPCDVCRAWSREGRCHSGSAVKLLISLGRLWNWGCVLSREQLVKMIVDSQGEEIDWGWGPLAGGRQLTLDSEIVLRFNWK